MASRVYSFGVEPIASHSWNADRTKVAISQNESEVHVYRYGAGAENLGGSWTKEQSLCEHAQRVTSIDWAPVSNRIVTCAADRNAYVWTLNNGKWEPVLVILRINRAATCVRWSPLENKFAVGSGARLISVCYYEPEQNWWVSKHIKRPLRSTVTCLDWHANNCLLGTGSTDFKARVFSAYIKDVDARQPSPTPWGTRMPFAQPMAEFASADGGWVHGVSFSSSGNKLAWATHGGILFVADAAAGMIVTSVRTDFLPFTSLIWVSESSIVAAGHSCSPLLFAYADGKLTFATKLDSARSPSASSSKTAMRRFQELDKKSSEDMDIAVPTIHQNTIFELEIHTGSKSSCAKFSSSGSDGQLVVWDLQNLSPLMDGLTIASEV